MSVKREAEVKVAIQAESKSNLDMLRCIMMFENASELQEA